MNEFHLDCCQSTLADGSDGINWYLFIANRVTGRRWQYKADLTEEQVYVLKEQLEHSVKIGVKLNRDAWKEILPVTSHVGYQVVDDQYQVYGLQDGSRYRYEYKYPKKKHATKIVDEYRMYMMNGGLLSDSSKWTLREVT